MSFAYATIVFLATLRTLRLWRRAGAPQLSAVAASVEKALIAGALTAARKVRSAARGLLAAFVVVATLATLGAQWLAFEFGRTSGATDWLTWLWPLALLVIAIVVVVTARDRATDTLAKSCVLIGALLCCLAVIPVFHGLWILDLRAALLAANPAARTIAAAWALGALALFEVIWGLVAGHVLIRITVGPLDLQDTSEEATDARRDAKVVTLRRSIRYPPAIATLTRAAHRLFGGWVYVHGTTAIFLACTNDWRILLWVAVWPDLLAFVHDRRPAAFRHPVPIMGITSWAEILLVVQIVFSLGVLAWAAWNGGFFPGPSEPPYLRSILAWTIAALTAL